MALAVLEAVIIIVDIVIGRPAFLDGNPITSYVFIKQFLIVSDNCCSLQDRFLQEDRLREPEHTIFLSIPIENLKKREMDLKLGFRTSVNQD